MALRSKWQSLPTEAINPSTLGIDKLDPGDIVETMLNEDRKVLTAEDRRFRWDQFLTGMHARGGFEHDTTLQRSWSLVVDLVQIGILLWIASGLVMWWELRGHRRWGALTMLAGTATFLVFASRL